MAEKKTLYEIDKALLDCCDFETGEILDLEKFKALAMERQEKILGVGCWIRNLKAEIKEQEALIKPWQDEIDAHKKRIASLENLVESLSGWLLYATNGEKFKDNRVSIYTSKTAPLLAFKNGDEQAFLEWAKGGHSEYLKYADPTVDKTKVKEALACGIEFDNVTLEQKPYVVVR